MERSTVVEQNQQKGESPPLAKSLGSLIRIDTISIDLAGAMENHPESRNSILTNSFNCGCSGYAAEMRKKDMSICSPFAFDGNQNKSVEQTSILPPIHVAKFRWWHCQNCLREMGATSAAEESGVVLDIFQSKFMTSRNCSHMQSPSGAARQLSGHENGAGNDVNMEISHPRCDVFESIPCFLQENNVDGPDTGLVDFCEPSCPSRAAADIKNVECMDGRPAETCQKETLSSADDEQRILSMACEIPQIGGRSDKGINFVERLTSTIPSVELAGNDNLSSKNDGIFAENSHHDQHHDNSSGLIRQKSRKVRLLTELLGSKENAENDHIRRDGALSSVMPNESGGIDLISALRAHVAVQANFKKRFGGPKGKRKIPQDKDRKPLDLIPPRKLTKKAKAIKKDAEITNTRVVITDFESEEYASAGANLQDGVRSTQWATYRIDKNPPLSKKKNKQTRVEVGFSPVKSHGELVPNTKRIKTGDAAKTAADGGFPQSEHGTFINRGSEPYLSVSPRQAGRKPCLFKERNKQVGAGLTCLRPQQKNVLGEGSIVRKDSSIVTTDPDTTRKVLGIPHERYAVEQRNEKSCIGQIGDGVDPLLLQWKATPREVHYQIKPIIQVGELSVPHTSPPDTFFRKGLLCDLNEKIPDDGTSPPREMQNHVSREYRSYSQHQQLDFSGTQTSENMISIQERGNDDIPIEIVELMARNQYERHHHEAGRNYFFSEQINDRRKAKLMGFPRLYGNEVLRSSNGENCGMRASPDGMGMVTTGFSALSQSEEMQLGGGIHRSDSCSIANVSPQSCRWKGDKVASRFASLKMPILEVSNSYLNGSRHGEEPEHLRPILIPNHKPFGLNIPQKHATVTSNFETDSIFPNLNFMNQSFDNLQKQNGISNSESFRTSGEYPFDHKQRGIDLNTKVSESVDLPSNETIPAMHLLSLMEARMQSSSSFSLDGKPKIFTKPFFPCDHHSKFNANRTSKIPEKPLFSYDHHSVFHGKNHPVERSCQCSTVVPAVGSSVSLVEIDGNLTTSAGFTGQFPLKSEKQGKALSPETGCSLQKSDRKRCISKKNRCSVNRNPADFSIPGKRNIYMISGKDLKFGSINSSSKGRSRLINVDGRKQQRIRNMAAMKENRQHLTC
ncbi:hypothetical protein U1Q18_018792 [Sarracenia purpurea var. burkii]